MFLVVITPLGLLMRWFGRDSLGGRFEPSARSYWTAYDPHRPGHYFHEY